MVNFYDWWPPPILPPTTARGDGGQGQAPCIYDLGLLDDAGVEGEAVYVKDEEGEA